MRFLVPGVLGALPGAFFADLRATAQDRRFMAAAPERDRSTHTITREIGNLPVAPFLRRARRSPHEPQPYGALHQAREPLVALFQRASRHPLGALAYLHGD